MSEEKAQVRRCAYVDPKTGQRCEEYAVYQTASYCPPHASLLRVANRKQSADQTERQRERSAAWMRANPGYNARLQANWRARKAAGLPPRPRGRPRKTAGTT